MADISPYGSIKLVVSDNPRACRKNHRPRHISSLLSEHAFYDGIDE